MISNTPSYEFILRQFQTCGGLYILGAGVSAGAAPLGMDFWISTPTDYLGNVGSFSVDIPMHSELTQTMISKWSQSPAAQKAPSESLEVLQRIPDYFARLYLKHCLSEFRFSGRQNDSYRIFQYFYPSLILNYNHDGLAADYVGQFHHVLDMHGTIDSRYGSPRMHELIAAVREYDLPDIPDGILMGVPESYCDVERQLSKVARAVTVSPPDFIAIIGYSFAKNEGYYNDHISLDRFLHMHRHFRGNIYVIDPDPDALQDLIGDGLKSQNVFAVNACWNVLACAFMKSQRVHRDQKSLNYVYQQVLDTFGSKVVFPLVRADGAARSGVDRQGSRRRGRDVARSR